MARTHRKKSSYSRYSGTTIRAWDEKKFNKMMKSVVGYANTGIKKLEKGTKKIGPEVTMYGNRTYSKLKTFVKNVEEAYANNDRELLNQLFKEGSNLIISGYSTPSNIIKSLKKQDEKHPFLKNSGYNILTREYLFHNAKDVFNAFTEDQIKKLTSDRILQIVMDFLDQGKFGKDLIDDAVKKCDEILGFIRQNGTGEPEDDEEDFEEGLNPWKLKNK